MDALCITSHNESQPLVLFEALAKKVLPIGWEAGDVTGKFGLILPAGKPPADLADAFADLWSRADVWKTEVNRRFAMVKSTHTWQQVFGDYRSLFLSHLKNNTAV